VTDKPIEFSPQQKAVFQWVQTGRGSAFVEAVAGAGKTTTIVQACKLMTGSVAFAAYNKKIAAEIETKAAEHKLGDQVRVGTFHKFGLNAWRRVAGDRLNVDARAKQDAIALELALPDELTAFVTKLTSLAKNSAIGVPGFGRVDDVMAWRAIIDHHDLADDLEDPRDLPVGITFAQRALALSRDMARELIDFDDMIYMPVVTNCRVWQNDWLLVDEAQDINPARRAIARKMLRPNGRAIFVGDRHQAIYGFTGADADAVDRITKDFACQLIPLTTTYRCPKAVVAAARDYVDHIEAHPSAPEGIVSEAHEDDLTTLGLTKEDAILCRLTRPLVSTAFKLIRAGIPCHVEGRDIGAGLLKLAGRWKRIKTVDKLRARLEEYMEAEVEKLIAKKQEVKAEAVQDRVETLLVLMDGCETVTELKAKVEGLFTDSEDGHQSTLTLSTVHKSKGREWQRVFVLGFAKFMPSKMARQLWQMEQENNLIYVAFTRAKAELVIVEVSEKKKEDAIKRAEATAAKVAA
jgi:superfamily I DNA/RNA helicase